MKTSSEVMLKTSLHVLAFFVWRLRYYRQRWDNWKWFVFYDWLTHLIFQELEDLLIEVNGQWSSLLIQLFLPPKNKLIQVMIMTLPISNSLLITKTQDKMLPILWRLVERRHSYDACSFQVMIYSGTTKTS